MKLFKDRHPDAGIVFRRGILEFWLPSLMQAELPYNPNHLPVVRRPDPLWYFMYYECVRLAGRTNDMALADALLIEVLRQ